MQSQSTKPCEWCGEPFEPNANHPETRFCSRSCAAKGPRKHIPPCPLCGKRIPQTKMVWCSKACELESREQETIRAAEEQIGEPLGSFLQRRYVEEWATLTQVQTELGLGSNWRRTKRWLKRYGIDARTKAEVARRQHQRNPARGEAFAALIGSHADRCRQAIGRQKNPRGSSLEKAAGSLLREFGLEPVAQYAFDIYNVDLALPGLKLAIEIDGGNWHQSDVRHRERDARKTALLQAAGWRVERFGAGDFGRLMRLAGDLEELEDV